MRIIRPGRTFTIECSGCECRYTIGINETEDCGFFHKSICPECGHENILKIKKFNVDVDKENENGNEDAGSGSES